MSAPRSKRNSRGGRTTKKKSTGLRATRRRLSVVSDNKLIEGISSIGQNGAATKVEEDESKSNHVVRCFWGSSKKGYVQQCGSLLVCACSRGVGTGTRRTTRASETKTVFL